MINFVYKEIGNIETSEYSEILKNQGTRRISQHEGFLATRGRILNMIVIVNRSSVYFGRLPVRL
jgi:hypothetical protein